MGDEPSNVIHLPHLADPKPTAEGVRSAVDHILKALAHPDWKQSVPTQAATIRSVQEMWPVFDKPMRDAIEARLADSLNSPLGRIQLILSLNNEPDVRKALRWQARPFKMEPGEHGYPEPDEGWLGNYLYYARECKASLGHQFWAAVAVLGAACRQNIYLDVGGSDMLFPNQYLLIEGPSGTGKSTSCGRATTVLEEANRILDDRMGEGKGPTIHVIPERVTPSALFEELKGAGTRYVQSGFEMTPSPKGFETCAILPASELSTLLGDGTYNPREVIGMLTALFDGRLDDSTIKRGLATRLRNITLTCLFGSTLSWLRHNIDKSAFGGGFLGSRLLVISRTAISRKYPTAPPVDPIQRRALAEYLVELMCHRPTELEFQPAAQSLYEEWFNVSPQPLGDDPSAPYYHRRDIHLKKLIMALTVSRARQPWITLGTVEQAIRLLEMEERRMLPAFRAIAGHAELEEMEWLESLFMRHAGEMDRETVVRKSRYRLGTLKRIDDIINVLVAMGSITKGTRGKAGREVYRWNRQPGGLGEQHAAFAIDDTADEVG